ncbi:MAG TPA: PKD domain-containing protein, partial [Chitinophagales bacterium]|nr:PKD domain-containing protein [Chitinophagales bacterium]
TFCTSISTCTSTPVASFNISYPGGNDVQFTDLSSNAAQWIWNFGDGNSDSTQNPVHTYAQNGTYNVTLTVYDSCNNASSIIQQVSLCNGFVANFGFTGNSNTILFSDSTLGIPLSWNWNFGDGDSSQLENPSHAYTSGGTYMVCLTVSGDGCSPQTICKTISVCNPVALDSFTYATALYQVSFFDASQNDTAWYWDFGDGNFSTEQDPEHTFVQPGIYMVCEIVSNTCNTDSICELINVQCLIVESSFGFTANDLDVSFVDQSLNAASWQWDFGDGNFSSEQNPTHTYLLAGTYHVCLMTSDNCTNDTLCEDLNVQCPPLVAAFTFVQANDTIGFADQSVNAMAWQWDFGDGNFSSLQNPSHIYSQPGTYHVCLVTSDNCSSDTVCDDVIVQCPLFVASFTFLQSDDTLWFTDESVNAIQWQWDFGDGIFSSLQNPSHTYSQAGTYQVCLMTSDSCSSDTLCEDVIVQCPPFIASFTFLQSYDSVWFTDESANAIQWQWDFGDGNFSSLQNPSHTYSQAGTYHVCLMSSDNCSSDTLCEDMNVQCPPFTAAFTFVQSNDTVVFTDQSANAIQWQWDFGDGNFSSLQNPSHTYSQAGTYHVCLMTSDNCSSDTLCEDVIVQCPLFVAAFTFVQSYDTVEFTDESANAIQWQWDFGDGNFSSLQNPSHIYSQAGTYHVCLLTSDNCSSDTLCEDVMVQCPPFIAAFTLVQSNDTAWFTDQSVNAIQWQWDFGDGNFSSEQNPVHIYDTTGIFFVCLITYDNCSFDTLCDSLQVIPLIVSSASPEKFFLSVFPNPVHGAASITFFIPQSSPVAIMLYDVSGKEERLIFDGTVNGGKHSTPIHCQNLSAGTYFLELKSEREFAVRKLIIE